MRKKKVQKQIIVKEPIEFRHISLDWVAKELGAEMVGKKLPGENSFQLYRRMKKDKSNDK